MAAVLSGNLAGQAIGFLATLIIIRNLSPERFGLLATSIAVMGLASQLSDLGISTGFVRYASQYLKEDARKADLLFKITLYLKVFIGVTVMIVGVVLSEPISTYLFKSQELTPLLRLAFIGSLGATLWGYLQSILQSLELFVKYAWINIFNNVLKLAGIILVLHFWTLQEYNSMLVIVVVPFAGFILDGIIVPRGFLKAKGEKKEHAELLSQLVHFSKWVTLSTVCTMLFMRLDIFMLQNMTTPREVGIYNSANQLAMLFPVITGALTISLLPKVSALSSREEIRGYIIKIMKIIPLVAILFLLLFTVSTVTINLLLGTKYMAAVPIYKVLLFAFVIGVIINPLSLILYTLNKPQILTYMNFSQLILSFVLNYILIQRVGALGAAISSFAVRLLALIIVTAILYRFFRSSNVNVDVVT